MALIQLDQTMCSIIVISVICDISGKVLPVYIPS
jgi:hypothetical protein